MDNFYDDIDYILIDKFNNEYLLGLVFIVIILCIVLHFL